MRTFTSVLVLLLSILLTTSAGVGQEEGSAENGAQPSEEGQAEQPNPLPEPEPDVDIFEAIKNEDLALLERGLKAGADPNQTTTYNRTALFMAVLKQNYDMMALLLGHGADPNKGSASSSPLHNTASRESAGLTALLLMQGAQVNALDGYEKTPLHKAAKSGRLENVALLLGHGANINQVDNKGMTPLHYAANKGHLQIVAMLLARGADPQIKNGEGKTARQLAWKEGRAELVAMIGWYEKRSADAIGEDKMRWVRVEPGAFERKGHPITLTFPYEIMATEVTQQQFERVMGFQPSHFSECGADCPVEMVSWVEAIAYANRLSEQAGLPTCFTCTGASRRKQCTLKPAYARLQECPGYRLPTDAEWELAARAGTGTEHYCGEESCAVRIAWCEENSEGKTHPVAQKEPNAWGLYDMSGNVMEWCWDWRHPVEVEPATNPIGPEQGDRRVMRGGSWQLAGSMCNSVTEYSIYPREHYSQLGFRLVRTAWGKE